MFREDICIHRRKGGLTGFSRPLREIFRKYISDSCENSPCVAGSPALSAGSASMPGSYDLTSAYSASITCSMRSLIGWSSPAVMA